jgi:hypothetical protein
MAPSSAQEAARHPSSALESGQRACRVAASSRVSSERVGTMFRHPVQLNDPVEAVGRDPDRGSSRAEDVPSGQQFEVVAVGPEEVHPAALGDTIDVSVLARPRALRIGPEFGATALEL